MRRVVRSASPRAVSARGQAWRWRCTTLGLVGRTRHPTICMSSLNCRVVLVRPQFAGNIGASARVMRNTGLDQLVLVAPKASPDDREARQLSTHGEEILDRARTVSELGEAVAD